MAMPNLSCLSQEDLLKLLKFSSDLGDNYNDFINTTLRSLDDVFDLPISTYTIFSQDAGNNIIILENHSNFFTPKDLEFYNNGGYLSDTSFINSRVDFARNSNKYVFVTEYHHDATDYLSQQMRGMGIKYQIRVGAHKRGISPLHVLSIYLPDDTPAPDDYQTALFSAIGKVFSEHVGNYKNLQICNTVCRCYVKGLTGDYGFAIYEPYTNTLEYNRNFAQLNPGKSVRSYVEELMDVLPKNWKGDKPFLFSRGSSQFTIQEMDDVLPGSVSYYLIKSQHLQEPAVEAPSRPAIKSQYLTHGLTLREIDVITLIEGGLSNSEISERLVISMSTVKTHIKNIFSKYGVGSRTELLRKLQEEN